ncbi:MAG: hypothetical protein J6K13_07385 [Clostridia bacterium]|nr:hypothetical protein [Clostridia bacterium]
MLRKIAALCCAMLMLFSVTTAHGQVERHALLDEGFKLLEKGNIFIDRYNRETGAAAASRSRTSCWPATRNTGR